MTPDVTDVVLCTFLAFCRIGTCLMLMPGYGSTNVPAQVRLLLAIAVSLALAPFALPTLLDKVHDASPTGTVSLIASEMMIGVLVGLMGRIFFIALQTLATASAMAIGLGSMPGVQTDESEPLPALVPLIVTSATVMFFLTDQHWEVLRGLSASYTVWPPQRGFDVVTALTQLSDRMSDAFALTLRISSPFLIYGVVVNFAVGLANKLTPSIPVYFISMPFVLAGGLILLQITISESLLQFNFGLAAWLGE
jgi:flagellar biosynthetic protein FliR